MHKEMREMLSTQFETAIFKETGTSLTWLTVVPQRALAALEKLELRAHSASALTCRYMQMTQSTLLDKSACFPTRFQNNIMFRLTSALN